MNNKNRRQTMAPLLIIGPTYLDILSRSCGERGRTGCGQIEISLGGVAYDTAYVAAGRGIGCRFVPLMRSSPFADLVQESLEEKGVEVIPVVDDSLSLGGYCAHVGELGNLVTATAACVTPVGGVDGKLLDKCIAGASAVVADFGMGTAVLRPLLRRATALQVPVFLIGRHSEELLKELTADDPPDAICLTYDGLRRLIRSLAAELPAGEAREVAGRLASTLLVLDAAADQVSVIDASDVVHTPLRDLSQQAKRAPFFPAHFLLHLIGAMEAAPYFDLAIPRAIETLAAEEAGGSGALPAVEPIEQTIDRIHDAARTDALTSALNRRAVENAMRSPMLRGFAGRGELALMLVDIDHFKSINDSFGHPAGDVVIRWVAEILREVLRECDLVGRWGGEEFIGLLPGVGPDEAAEVAERVRRRIDEDSPRTGLLPRPVTVSIGVAQARPGEDLRESLIARADEALYRAKRSGRNRVVMADDPTRQQGRRA